jgi:hypothetical protein
MNMSFIGNKHSIQKLQELYVIVSWVTKCECERVCAVAESVIVCIKKWAAICTALDDSLGAD